MLARRLDDIAVSASWQFQPSPARALSVPLLARYLGFGVDDSAERRIANDRIVNAYRGRGFSAQADGIAFHPSPQSECSEIPSTAVASIHGAR